MGVGFGMLRPTLERGSVEAGETQIGAAQIGAIKTRWAEVRALKLGPC
jgi:hypothetical protein